MMGVFLSKCPASEKPKLETTLNLAPDVNGSLSHLYVQGVFVGSVEKNS